MEVERKMRKILLPDDLLTDILSRLTMDEVMQCRGVSKDWKKLIFNPVFADLYRQRNINVEDDGGDSSMVSFIFITRFELKSPRILYGEFEESVENVNLTIKTLNHPPLDENYVLSGSCNGLVCLAVTHHGIIDPVYIFNPITREAIDLPRFSEEDLQGNGTDLKGNNEGDFMGRLEQGFGYDLVTNQYKVVRIYFHEDEDIGNVYVYTLGAGRGWVQKRVITRGLQSFGPLDSGIYANGSLFWLESNGKGAVLGFDLTIEDLFELPRPPCKENYRIQVLGGLLCVIHEIQGECVEIWSLMKFDGSWEWNLEFKMDCKEIRDKEFLVGYEPLALTRSGVLFWEEDGTISLYKKKEKKLETLVEHKCNRLEAIQHMNSFISLKALGEEAKVIEFSK